MPRRAQRINEEVSKETRAHYTWTMDACDRSRLSLPRNRREPPRVAPETHALLRGPRCCTGNGERGSFLRRASFVAATIGFPLGGLLGDFFSARLGAIRARRNVVIAGMLPASLLLYFGATVDNPVWAIAALSLAAGLGALTQSSYWVIAIERVPSHTATAVGITNTEFNLGGVCSPILTPWIAARYGVGHCIDRRRRRKHRCCDLVEVYRRLYSGLWRQLRSTRTTTQTGNELKHHRLRK